MAKPTKYLDEYEIEYTSEPLVGTEYWGAYVAIFVPSDNPMHKAEICPKHRVAADVNFSNAKDAEAQAEKAGTEVLEWLRSKHNGYPGSVRSFVIKCGCARCSDEYHPRPF